MSDYINLTILVEGETELRFVKEILYSYLFERSIIAQPIVIGRPGCKGGNINFDRVFRDISIHIKQRSDNFISTFIDYYGLSRWPGLREAQNSEVPKQIAEKINKSTIASIAQKIDPNIVQRRFIPFVAVHEFEALLFSDTSCLAAGINVPEKSIKKILNECGEPESINNNYETAPSKRLLSLFSRYKKTTTGITIAREIGIEKMREKCPVFNDWLMRLENLVN